MRKILKFLFTVVGLFVGLLIAGLALFVLLFDANAYKEDVALLVKQETGRELRFQGDIELTLFPALGMKLGAVTFANAPGFGEKPMLGIGEASISVDVVSLMRLEPEIDRLRLRDLEINLMRNGQGVNNWDDLVDKGDSQVSGGDSGASTDGSGDSTGGAGSPPGDVELKGSFAGVDIENLRLLWLDEQIGERYEVTDLDISTGRIVPNESFPMTLHLDASSAADGDVSVDLATDVTYLIDQQHLALDRMALTLNEFSIAGKLAVSNFAKPALRFDLSSQKLDVDALLGTPPAEPTGPQPPSNDDAAAAGSAAASTEDTRIELPTAMLRDLDIDGSLAIDWVKIENLIFEQFDMKLSAQQGRVALKPVRLNAYGGSVLANVLLDVTGDLPKYGVNKTLTSVQIGDLLNDYLGESPISGQLDAEANLSTTGEWISQLKSNSNGRLQLAFADGALNGFNIRQSVENARARLRGEDPPAAKTRKTDFTSLTLSGVIRNGVFSSDDLDLQAPLLRVGGRGEADLNRELIDYLVDAKLVGTFKGQDGGTADDLAGLAIPVRITGPFSGPDLDVQLDEMLKARAEAEKARLKAEIEAQKKELEAQIEAEKKALEEAKKRELEKQIEVEKARAEEKALEKLQKLFD